MIWIYALIDPRTDCIRYIGKSVDPVKRLKGHVWEAKREQHRRARWILGLLKLGLRPVVAPIERTSDPNTVECFWIASLLAAGAKLVNDSPGGETIPWTPELRERVTESNRGRTHGAQARANMSAASKGKPKTLEHAANISKGKKAQMARL